MGFGPSERVVEIRSRLEAFMDERIFPREREYEELVNDQRNLCRGTSLPDVFTHGRFRRIADGPDEVHMSQLGKLTIRNLQGALPRG